MEGLRHGHLVASQLMDVAIRVPAIRPFAVEQMALLLESSSGFAIRGITGQVAFSSMCEVLYAAAWICGEFAALVFFLTLIRLCEFLSFTDLFEVSAIPREK